MRVTMEAGCGVRDDENFKGGIRDKNNLPGAGFAHFERRDVG